MSRNSRTDEALDRVRQAAAHLQPAAAKAKPLAGSTGAAAKRGVHRTRAWAAPRVEHTGQVLEDSVAPKVSSLLSSVESKVIRGSSRPSTSPASAHSSCTRPARRRRPAEPPERAGGRITAPGRCRAGIPSGNPLS